MALFRDVGSMSGLARQRTRLDDL